MQDLRLRLAHDTDLWLLEHRPGRVDVEIQDEDDQVIWVTLEPNHIRQVADWLNEFLQENQDGGQTNAK